jgi:xylan 1,4-beta-xylosidase
VRILRVTAGLLLGLLLPAAGLTQSAGIRTYVNPLDLDYKYNFEQLNQGVSYRSGADPVVVTHKGEYFLFVTVSGGYWHSKDLIHWRFVTPTRWPFPPPTPRSTPTSPAPPAPAAR